MNNENADSKNKTIDVSLAPYSNAVDTATKGVVDGAGSILSRICLPAAEELGLLVQDKVRSWRQKNAEKLLQKTNEMLVEGNRENDHTSPRLAVLAIDSGSWIEDDQISEMWSGLLASSCTSDGKDESNLIFMNLLHQVTSLQVKILSFICEHASKKASPLGFVYAEELKVALDELIELTGIDDIVRLDREIDHLRSLELLHGGFPPPEFVEPEEHRIVSITPSSLGLNLYVRSKGILAPPTEYFELAYQEKDSAVAEK